MKKEESKEDAPKTILQGKSYFRQEENNRDEPGSIGNAGSTPVDISDTDDDVSQGPVDINQPIYNVCCNNGTGI